MAHSFTAGDSKLVVLPIRKKLNESGSLESGELKKELSHLQDELRFVEDAIIALERLAAMRLPKLVRRPATARQA